MATRKKDDLAMQLQTAISDSGLTLYAIAKGSGVDYGSVWRFANHQRSLDLTSAAMLAGFLGFELRKAR